MLKADNPTICFYCERELGITFWGRGPGGLRIACCLGCLMTK